MRARYDEIEITLTPEFIAALEAVMATNLAMMRDQDREYAESWGEGRCIIGNLARADGIDFIYGRAGLYSQIDDRGAVAVVHAGEGPWGYAVVDPEVPPRARCIIGV